MWQLGEGGKQKYHICWNLWGIIFFYEITFFVFAFVLSRPLWERQQVLRFFVILSRPKWKERISFPSVPQDRHSNPMWKPVNGWERTCHLLPCFQLPSAMGERERSFLASTPSCCLPSTRYACKWLFVKRICEIFFFLNRQSYNLNEEYLRKNRRIFGVTSWWPLPLFSLFSQLAWSYTE